MQVLVIDVGGTHIKCLKTGETNPRKFVSGPTMTAEQMVAGVKQATSDWTYEAVSIGYPGPVYEAHIVADPMNLGPGWLHFDFSEVFGCPVKLYNDAAMQALGSYETGKMLFLGLGTGLGTAMVVEGVVAPMEIGHLPYRKRTYEDYLGLRGLERFGKKKWRKLVFDVVEKLTMALQPTDIVLGGGNSKELKELPPLCRLGSNANAFKGGFRLWQSDRVQPTTTNGQKKPHPSAIASG